MLFRTSTDELAAWVARKREIESSEAQPGFQILVARIRQELRDAEEQLEKCWRWNWLKIFRLMERRNTCIAILDYIRLAKVEGEQAERVLLRREPETYKDLKPAVFNATRGPN